jgi:DNA repair protein RecO (recombination protein O)
VLSAFELVWLRELGYSPRLDACAGCGAAVGAGPRVGFSPTAGGVLCGGCLPAAHDRRPVSAAALAAVRRLADGPAELPQDAAGEVRRLLGHTVSAVLGRRPKLLAYVDGN